MIFNEEQSQIVATGTEREKNLDEKCSQVKRSYVAPTLCLLQNNTIETGTYSQANENTNGVLATLS